MAKMNRRQFLPLFGLPALAAFPKLASSSPSLNTTPYWLRWTELASDPDGGMIPTLGKALAQLEADGHTVLSYESEWCSKGSGYYGELYRIRAECQYCDFDTAHKQKNQWVCKNQVYRAEYGSWKTPKILSNITLERDADYKRELPWMVTWQRESGWSWDKGSWPDQSYMSALETYPYQHHIVSIVEKPYELSLWTLEQHFHTAREAIRFYEAEKTRPHVRGSLSLWGSSDIGWPKGLVKSHIDTL